MSENPFKEQRCDKKKKKTCFIIEHITRIRVESHFKRIVFGESLIFDIVLCGFILFKHTINNVKTMISYNI